MSPASGPKSRGRTISGFVSSSRRRCLESTSAELPRSRLRSAHSVSHALDGFLLQAPCGFVSPHCHVQDSHFRGFPRSQAVSSSSPDRALVSFRCRASREASFSLPARHRRLQGIDPGSDPLSRVGGLDRRATRSPHVISPPSGLLGTSALPSQSLHSCPLQLRLAVTETGGLQRFRECFA